MTKRWVLLKNAIANLGRGGATAIVALLLPPLLVRHMSAATYGVWVLVLQVAAYISYLDLGLQTAVGRYVAYTTEKQDFRQRNSVFSTAFVALGAAAGLSLILLVIAIYALHLIFPATPAQSLPMMRLALFLLGLSLALGLPASAWNGVFIGLQRNEIPAVIIGTSRLVSAVAVVVVAFRGKSIVVMAACMAIVNVLSYVVQYLVMRRVVPDIEFQINLVQRSTAGELWQYCVGLTVMSFSMLLVTGFDLILVGRFEFSAVTPYSVSASMIAFISGVLAAVLSAMMPHAAAMHAREQPEEMGRLVITSTQIAIVLLVFTGIPVLLYAAPILKIWIGQQYVPSGYTILSVLIIANIIRLIGAPYAIILVAAGQQRLIKISPLTEGLSNLVASIILGSMLGAIGVALGTLVGSFFSIAAHLLYSMPRTNAEISLSRWKYLRSGVMGPFLATAPLLLVAGLSMRGALILDSRAVTLLTAVILSVPGSVLLLKRSGVLRGGGIRARTGSATE